MGKIINFNPIRRLGISLFFEMQVYLLPFSLFYYQQNGLTVSDFFLFQSIFFFVSLFLEIPTGYIADLISKKYIIVFAYLFNCLRLFLYLCFSGWSIVLAGEICYALCKSFLSGSVDSYVYDYLVQNHSEKMLSKYGRVSSMMSFGTALASISSVFLYQFGGISLILIVEFIAAVIGVIIAVSLPKISSHTEKRTSLANLSKAFRLIHFQPALLLFILFSGICFAMTSLFTTSFQPILKSVAAPSILFSFIYFFNHLTRGFASRFTKELNSFLGIDKLCFLTTGLIVLSFLGLFIDLFTPPLWFVLITLLTVCISIAFHLSVQVTAVSKLHKIAPSHLRASSSSAMNMFFKCMAGLILWLFKNTLDGMGERIAYTSFSFFSISILLYLCWHIRKYRGLLTNISQKV